MTAAELAQLLVGSTIEISATRRERDAYRLLAVQCLHYCHRLQQDCTALERRYHALLERSRSLRSAVPGEAA